MNIKRIGALVTIVGLSFSSVAAAAGTDEQPRVKAAAPAEVLPMSLPISATDVPPMKRPALLPAMYAGLAATQAWDIYTTSAALKRGAYEANPVAAPFARNTAKMIGLKAATTAATIFFVERMSKGNRVGAVVLLAAINGATAAVAMHNAAIARGRR